MGLIQSAEEHVATTIVIMYVKGFAFKCYGPFNTSYEAKEFLVDLQKKFQTEANSEFITFDWTPLFKPEMIEL